METLHSIRKNIWQQLTKTQTEEEHPFRLATFATSNENTPNMRVAIIRKINQELAEIWFYTDYYSQKVQDIKDNNNINWLFYDPKEQTQVRLYGNAQVLHNPTANYYIRKNLPEYSNQDYLTVQLSGDSKSSNPILFEAGQGNKNFCIIKTKIHTIDWLQLTQKGYLQAKFELKNNEWKGEWLSS